MPPFLLALVLFVVQALAAPVSVLTLDGGVDPGSAEYLIQGIHKAESDGAAAVVIVMDTPGGLLSSTREIVQAELGAKVPVIVYVSPSGARAGSAGVFITMAAHIAAMAPGTNIGAAHPVDLFGGGLGPQTQDDEQAKQQDVVMQEKILNDTLAWTRAIAEQRGRDIGFAEEAVRSSESITDSEALERGVIDLIAPDLATLLQEVDGREVQTAAGPVTLQTAGAAHEHQEMAFKLKVVHFLSDPTLLFVLLALGLLGIYVEYHHPGLILPGVLGGICLVAVAVGLSILPFNIGGLLLVIGGFVLFALEIWVPSYGALTAGGIACLVLGGILLFDVKEFDLRVQLSTLIAVAALAGALALLVGFLVLRSHRRRVHTGKEGMLGEPGEVTEGGTGQGWVLVDGVLWRATWPGTLACGAQVRVKAVERLRLVVEPVLQKPDSDDPTQA
ncbi:MAG: nodulation protein NfeD [Pseudomonadota bacterium]